MVEGSEHSAATSAPGNNNRLILLLIAGLPVTMILAATWLWFFVVRGDLDLIGALGTANRGTLVQPPRQLAETELYTGSGEVFDFYGEEPQWTFVVANPGATCDSACEHLLYLTRQIHLAMGKEYNRIRRLYLGDTPLADTRLAVDSLSDDHPLPENFAAFMGREHGKLQPLRSSAAELQRLFPERGTAPDTWYLVDPAGWVMMSYDDSVSYKDVISDLKFLLKNSSN